MMYEPYGYGGSPYYGTSGGSASYGTGANTGSTSTPYYGARGSNSGSGGSHFSGSGSGRTPILIKRTADPSNSGGSPSMGNANSPYNTAPGYTNGQNTSGNRINPETKNVSNGNASPSVSTTRASGVSSAPIENTQRSQSNTPSYSQPQQQYQSPHTSSPSYSQPRSYGGGGYNRSSGGGSSGSSRGSRR